MQTVEWLTDAGLLNDAKYAHDFVASRLSTKPVSEFRLREQLRGHFVPDEIIDAELASLPDDTELSNAVEVAAKYLRQFASVEDETEKLRRVYARLQTRGYSHETIMKALRLAAEGGSEDLNE